MKWTVVSQTLIYNHLNPLFLFDLILYVVKQVMCVYVCIYMGVCQWYYKNNRPASKYDWHVLYQVISLEYVLSCTTFGSKCVSAGVCKGLELFDKLLCCSDLCTEQLIYLHSLAAWIIQIYTSAVRYTNVNGIVVIYIWAIIHFFFRYKIVVEVVIGEQRGEGVRMGSRSVIPSFLMLTIIQIFCLSV